MKIAPYIVIIILMISLFVQREYFCNEDCDCVSVDTTIIDTNIIVYELNIDQYTPEIESYYNIVYDTNIYTIYNKDSIIKEYYSSINLNDKIVNRYGTFFINDVISQNRILHRSFRAVLNSQIITKKEFVTEKRGSHFYAGLSVGGSSNKFSLGGSILVLTKRGNAYGASYDIINKNIMVTYYYKIW